ncbi:hypothetical protein Rsub_08478 [Raphidocelis subcapitata]|uniref:Prolyl 4-hydroxylase alpha subunit domain-containing protein n=1 Tax=Raphidocelis subcapitata TaxID=307507 RepID=A0A2V0PFB4_9CHLO|nr:hypothetical protein Rsub_08478 [Raphidocelis subcapitata]|eukprot:GBF95887.1 hypothetical protein Rsub_08478 [Raphidocelis subcapitata]
MAEFAPEAPPRARPRSTRVHPYPYLDDSFPGLRRVHAEPPVYCLDGFLPRADCAALIAAAQRGALQPLAYEDAVLLDTRKLWPLGLIVAAAAAFDTLHGSGAAGAELGPAGLLAAAAPAVLRWGAAVGALLGAVQLGVRFAIGGRVFTGTKWTVRGLFPPPQASSISQQRGGGGSSGEAADAEAAEAARRAAARFILSASRLLAAPPSHFEPPTVTRYQEGEQQRVHFDGRPAGDPSGLAEFMAAGGQRLVQVVCYLRTLEPSQGGCTRFHHPALGGLEVPPREGGALVFFPAFEDGRLDGRMAHSGARVTGRGAEKWIINTWLAERPVPAAVVPGEWEASGDRVAGVPFASSVRPN